MIEEIIVEETNKPEINNQENVLETENRESPVDKIKFGDILFNRKFKVFVKINKDGYVTEIANDLELKDTSDWTLIDEGSDDKFVFASTMYFDEPIIDDFGNYRYKIR